MATVSPACKAIDGAMKRTGVSYSQLAEKSGIDEARVISSTFAAIHYTRIVVI